jgi:hypothetical protein
LHILTAFTRARTTSSCCPKPSACPRSLKAGQGKIYFQITDISKNFINCFFNFFLTCILDEKFNSFIKGGYYAVFGNQQLIYFLKREIF